MAVSKGEDQDLNTTSDRMKNNKKFLAYGDCLLTTLRGREDSIHGKGPEAILG